MMHAGKGRYKLMAADLVATHSMMDHIGRYLPSVRMNGAAFSFVVDLIINYGSPVLHLVMVSCMGVLYVVLYAMQQCLLCGRASTPHQQCRT